MTTTERAYERLVTANPIPDPEQYMATAVEIDAAFRDLKEDKVMQTIKRKTETTRSPGPSRRRGLLVAAAALVVAIIAAGVVIGLVGGSSDEPDVGSLTPGPISSFEDIAGITYERQGTGVQRYLHFFEDGTFHDSSNRDLVVDRPQRVMETRFEGTEVFITDSSDCDQGTYKIHVLQNGHLQFVPIEDPCGGRSGLFNAEWAPVP